jgi:hypothetical protein
MAPGARELGTEAGSDPDGRPETAEDRAEQALAALDLVCQDHPLDCEAHFWPELHPDAQVPAVVDRFVTAQVQELRTLGFIVRWEPGARQIEIERGNTLTFRGDPQSDPPAP